jgi:hypothetical protein
LLLWLLWPCPLAASKKLRLLPLRPRLPPLPLRPRLPLRLLPRLKPLLLRLPLAPLLLRPLLPLLLPPRPLLPLLLPLRLLPRLPRSNQLQATKNRLLGAGFFSSTLSCEAGCDAEPARNPWDRLTEFLEQQVEDPLRRILCPRFAAVLAGDTDAGRFARCRDNDPEPILGNWRVFFTAPKGQ